MLHNQHQRKPMCVVEKNASKHVTSQLGSSQNGWRLVGGTRERVPTIRWSKQQQQPFFLNWTIKEYKGKNWKAKCCLKKRGRWSLSKKLKFKYRVVFSWYTLTGIFYSVRTQKDCQIISDNSLSDRCQILILKSDYKEADEIVRHKCVWSWYTENSSQRLLL